MVSSNSVSHFLINRFVATIFKNNRLLFDQRTKCGGPGAATAVVDGWKVSLTLSTSLFISPAASDAAINLDRVIIDRKCRFCD